MATKKCERNKKRINIDVSRLSSLLILMLFLLTTLLALGTPALPDVAQQRAAAAVDSLWSTFWDSQQAYLRRGTSSGDNLLPYWNYQESTHAVAVSAATLGYAKYGPLLKAMVAGQNAMDSTRQRGTGTGPGPSGSDGWTREYFDDMNWAGRSPLLGFHRESAREH